MKAFHFALILSSAAGFVALNACSKPGPTTPAEASDVDYYTCTMHPSVRSHDPEAKCPICGMDLVPVKKTDAQAKPDAGRATAAPEARAGGEPHDFTIPLDRQQLIGVTYATVEKRALRRTVRAFGTVATTTAGHWDYVARVDGYAHNLNVAGPGDRVEKGQVLMDLYSPDLVSTESEYVDLLRMRDNGRQDQNAATTQNAEHLLAGARARLQQWNISPAQIDAVEKTRVAEQFLPLTSPVNGIVEEVAVHQGRHVAVGDHLVDIVDLSSVWVWADFYESELSRLKPGLPVTISSSALPNLSIGGKIALVDPFLNEAKRTGRVRIDVDNSDSRLQPGEFVDVTLTLDEGEGLVVPAAAVLPTGEHSIVFVDMGSGRLEPRYAQIGEKFGDYYQVTGGLRVGERVVSSANFLVDAESQVQGALKSW
jgi:membrane fusion protein, copper/silver efflux system